MENFRTGVLDRLGFPVARLHEFNPRLVVLSISGFGHDGPEPTVGLDVHAEKALPKPSPGIRTVVR